MYEFSRPLGDTLRKARTELGLTQNQVADNTGIDHRTILNIENGKGNPKMIVLYPLVRSLRADPNEFFYPEIALDNPAIRRLRLLIESCSEQEAADLIPVIEAVLKALRNRESVDI